VGDIVVLAVRSAAESALDQRGRHVASERRSAGLGDRRVGVDADDDAATTVGRYPVAGSRPGPRETLVHGYGLLHLSFLCGAGCRAEALGAGAAGFLLKDTAPERILAALEAVMVGDVLVSPRETEILRLVGNGLSNGPGNGQIAGRLVLSESTVKTQVKHVMSKLMLSSRAQAVVVAYESGLVVPGLDQG
jgi:DNA-binding CsgD family transcriptional regulator